jgi:hypothetical protein
MLREGFLQIYQIISSIYVSISIHPIMQEGYQGSSTIQRNPIVVFPS